MSHVTQNRRSKTKMKKAIALTLALILAAGVGCSLLSGDTMPNREFVTDDELKSLYYDNRELINRIQEGLFSSDFIPNDGFTGSHFDNALVNSLVIKYDYEKGQLFSHDDPKNEKLKSIENVLSDINRYFLLVKSKEKYSPSIEYREIPDVGVVVEFEFFHKESCTRTGIIYTTKPEELWCDVIHLEGNWYLYRDILLD